MYRTSPHIYEIFRSGKGKAAWDAECERWHNLTAEQQQAEYDAWEAELHKRIKEDSEKRRMEYRQKEYEKSLKGAEFLYVNAEKPNSLDNGEATVSWIVVMLIGTIFNARWFIWIVATIIYLNYMCRHEIRQAKWDNEGRAEWEERIGRKLK